ncbi:hypothetical protein O0L34_g8758 [Tuta absoluta]|nr:hypothetical protein O0L34_g8758 [Tuta absoluta]
MSEIITGDLPSAASEKPVPNNEIVKFPPFPDPSDDDFEEDITEEERNYYKNSFSDLNFVKSEKLHCTACDRHLGCSAKNESRMRMHPMLRTLVCNTCHTFYNSGEFDKGEDGSELYCRWCGQGGQVYCCSDCPIVFCAKCIRRNFGNAKIREIENTDDWKCFKCSTRCLWDARAVCWALLRFCDFRNKFAYKAETPELKDAYQKACAIDESECCKAKLKAKKEKEAKKKEQGKIQPIFQRDAANKAATAINAINAVTKIPPTIQVKKFASINLDESPPKEKKAQKRQALSGPFNTVMLKNPVPVSNRMVNPVPIPTPVKKIRMPSLPAQMPMIRMPKNAFQNTYTRIRPKPALQVGLPPMAVLNNYVNNPQHMQNMINNYTNDNINLSLESLTQGLDMSAVMADNDVVCTPDFPMEPLCEVHEENNDDDVQCISEPRPVGAGRGTPTYLPTPPPLVPRGAPDLGPDNIIQMTENDVTVNAATGGLKFRVDPQTLSSNKMYRLPDGRVFAINSNPNMPGGYSATIVALADSNTARPATGKGSTYAAKLSAVNTAQTPSPKPSRRNHASTPIPTPVRIPKRTSSSKRASAPRSVESTARVCDMQIPVEWYRYNLIDAVDALEYSLSRLQKLKKEASTVFLRTRTVEEMRTLHKTLDSMLKTSACRFNEVRDNLNKEMKRYVRKKTSNDDTETADDDDDDDVEILNDLTEDPIFIDENSMDSNNATNGNMTAEVDLTGPASSDYNDSGDKAAEKACKEHLLDHSDLSNDNFQDKHKDDNSEKGLEDNDSNAVLESDQKNETAEKGDDVQTKTHEKEMNGDVDDNKHEDDDIKASDNEEESKNDKTENNENKDDDKVKEESRQNDSEKCDNDVDKDVEREAVDTSKDTVQEIKNDNAKEESNQVVDMGDDKTQDNDMTEEFIDSLLKDDNVGDDSMSASLNCMDIPEDFPEP